MGTAHSSNPGNAVQPRSQANLARLLKQRYILDKLYAIHEEEKQATAREFEPGDSTKIKNEHGIEIGSVGMTAPSMKAVPDDDSILLAYANDHGHEVEEFLPEDGTEEYNAVIALVVEAGRMDLLRLGVDPAVRKEVCDEVLTKWENSAGKDLPTGWSIKPASNPSFRLAKGRSAKAKAAFEAEMQPLADALERSAFREIEAGAQ